MTREYQQPMISIAGLTDINLPETATVQMVNLGPIQNPIAQACTIDNTDRLVCAIEEAFMQHAFCLNPAMVCTTTVTATQFADGSISYGLLQATPDHLKTMGGRFVPEHILNHPAESGAPFYNAFVGACQAAGLNALPGLTVDISNLIND